MIINITAYLTVALLAHKIRTAQSVRTVHTIHATHVINQSHHLCRLTTVRLKTSQRKIDFIPLSYVKQSVSFNSNFVRFLCKHFSRDKIENAMRSYALGATKNQSVIFWQIDINGKVRTGR